MQFRYLHLLLLACCLMTAGRAAERADASLRKWAESAGLSCYPFHEAAVYTDGHTKFRAMLDDIDAAGQTVDIEYFIYAPDSIGRLVTEHLHRAAQRGVRVRLLIDDYKSRMRNYGYDQAWLDSMATLGIETRLFDPMTFPWVNRIFRDHRKVVVIDDTISWVGGLNVADYYLNGNPETYGGWRDTHVRITGRLAAVPFGESFLRQWTHGEDSAAGQASPSALRSVTGQDVIFFERGRSSHASKAETRRAYVAAFRSARKSIRIVNPYFMPTASVRRALIDAIDRGVDVQIILPLVNDEPTLGAGNLNFAHRLVRHGARVYLYKGAFHHSKILMVDDCYCMIGSANLNSRSLRWDYEASCFLLSPEVTAELTAIFNRDLEACDLMTTEYYKSQKPGLRAKGWIVNHIFTPLL